MSRMKRTVDRETRTIQLGELFTAEEIDRAYEIWCRWQQRKDRPVPAAEIAEVIVAPVLDRINETTGQENDARYLGYLLCWIFERHNGQTSAETGV
jgi:hypothetical protein